MEAMIRSFNSIGGSTLIITVLLIASAKCDLESKTVDSKIDDRSKNEIIENVSPTDLSNEITTAPKADPLDRGDDVTPPPAPILTGRYETVTSSKQDCSKKSKIDPMDQHLLDGLLDIVDAKFSTLNNRLMTLERGINNLQYYNVRSFRVVNTHLHAVDTILHSMGTQMSQVENQNLAVEQAVGGIKNEVVDLQSMSNGVFNAIEQNLVHFHSDMQHRLTEVKQGIEHSNVNIEQLRNDTSEVRLDLDGLKEEQYTLKLSMDNVNMMNKEILQTSSALMNVSMSTYETSKSIQKNTLYTNFNLDRANRNLTSIARGTDEIRNGLALVLANMSSSLFSQDVDDEGDVDDDRSTYQEFRLKNSQMHMSCSKMLEIMDEKFKHINVTLSDNNGREGCDDSPKIDPGVFKIQTKKLLRALSTVNENVYQSVTLYKHTGNLIERVVSDTENIASEQIKLREELLAYIMNGTFELFNRSIPDFSDFVGNVLERPLAREKETTEDKCNIPKSVLEEIGQLSRNGSQLVELLTDLSVSSSSTIRQSLDNLNNGITSLNKFQEDTLNNYLMNKVEAFSRDDRSSHLKDIQNKTDLIYLFAEAIASNTGWIPFVYHRVTFVENQVNKTLNYISNMDTILKEIQLRQKVNMAFIFQPKKPLTDDIESETLELKPDDEARTEDDDTNRKFSTPNMYADSQYANESATFGHMMDYVFKTNQKINRLIPALTNLLGEPEPYITLVDGNSDKEGRVEIYHKGQWGTIPGSIGHVEASYVCRKLGYLGGISVGNGYFGNGSGAFWNLNVTCLRTRWCSAINHVTHPASYSHEADVGVICDHMLRLTKTNEEEEQEVARHTGKLEIYHQNSWMPICFKGWGRQETSVACKQLGFREGAGIGEMDASLTDSNWLTNVTCSGSEDSLDACVHNEFKFNGCPDNEYVSMICS